MFDLFLVLLLSFTRREGEKERGRERGGVRALTGTWEKGAKVAVEGVKEERQDKTDNADENLDVIQHDLLANGRVLVVSELEASVCRARANTTIQYYTFFHRQKWPRLMLIT